MLPVERATSARDELGSDAALLAELRQFVGHVGAPPRAADSPVNEPMIRHWCQAVGDTTPIYTDEREAVRFGHPGIVAPPTMLQSWTLHDRRFTEEELGPDSGEERMARRLQEAGYTSVVATDTSQEYMRYLRLGDVLTYRSVIESVSEEKRTRLGDGFFVAVLANYTDQRGEVVGRMRSVIFRFRPAMVAEAAGEEA